MKIKMEIIAGYRADDITADLNTKFNNQKDFLSESKKIGRLRFKADKIYTEFSLTGDELHTVYFSKKFIVEIEFSSIHQFVDLSSVRNQVNDFLENTEYDHFNWCRNEHRWDIVNKWVIRMERQEKLKKINGV